MVKSQLARDTTTTRMLTRIRNFLARLLGQKRFVFDPHAGTIPEAFDYPIENYRHIVDDLKSYLELGNQLSILNLYLKSSVFEKYQLDLNNPTHAALLGYAFCTAIVMKKDQETKKIAEQVLESFYQRPPVVLSSPNKLVS